jgi:signal transduction histidine kinase/CheY-like chemotaxis protein
MLTTARTDNGHHPGLIQRLLNAGVQPGNGHLNKRVRFINTSSFIAASLVFVFGTGLPLISGNTAILYPALIETALFILVIWLNYRRRYGLSTICWHLTFSIATLIFGIMLSTVIDATHMAGFLIGAPLLILKKGESKLLVACIIFSALSLIGIEVNNSLRIFEPLEVPGALHPVFRVATWFTVIFLNVVVILFYLKENNTLIDRLKKTNARMNRVNKKLARASAYKSVYVRETTHELRAPLNALYAISQLLDDEDLKPGDVKEMHSSIRHSVNHALDIINNVLELAKIESGNTVKPVIERVPVRKWVNDVAAMYKYQAALKQVAILVNTGEDVPVEINMGRIQVTQVLNNLLSNAIKFSATGGAIHVNLGVAGDSWQFSIQDDGVGMDEETIKKVFLQFYTTQQNNAYGTGLGMHIAKKLTDRLGGTIEAQSTPGKGSVFTVTLPLHPAGAAAAEPTGLSSQPFRHVNVLLIDDDVVSSHYYSKLLSKMGCNTLVAATGESGFTMALASKPDLVLMDLNLPDMNGKTLLLRFRQHPQLHNIPVVFLSGNSAEEEKKEALQLGALNYLVKPVHASGLGEILARLSH